MSKVILLALTMLFSMVFLAIPDGYSQYDFFVFSDQKLTFQTYLYFLFQDITIAALSYIIAMESKEYFRLTVIYFWIQVAGLIDYVMSYNSVWFTVGPVPISVNTLGITAFAASCFHYFWKDSK